MVGKYEVVAQPIPGSSHMLRYTVSVAGTRIGATVSVPTESDCRYLEKPPAVPPLKPFQGAYRPGRPKKGSTPPTPVAPEARQSIPAEDLPGGLSLRDLGVTEDRWALVDKRKAWREQEQRLVERWNAAAARQRDVHAEISRLPPTPDNAGPSADLLLRAEAARVEIEALRKQIARLKVEFNSGKRY